MKNPKKKYWKLFKDKTDASNVHFFQFENWKYSIDWKYLIDGVMIISLAIVLQYTITSVLSNSNDISDIMKNISSMQQELLSASSSKVAEIQQNILEENDKMVSLINDSYSKYDIFCNMILLQETPISEFAFER